nr:MULTISPECIES: sigma-70 family RNA polymerase sigma factor [Clostridia]
MSRKRLRGGKRVEELVRKAKQKDPEAFTELMRLHMQSMYKVARAYLSSDEDAADAVQETILTCYEKLPLLKHDKYFKTWMTKILMRKCCDILKSQKVIDFNGKTAEQGACDKSFEELEWKEVIGLLDEKYRLIMVLYYVEGFQTGEIAQILDMNENTVRTRLKRGKEQMQDVYVKKSGRRKPHGRKTGVAAKAAGRGGNSGSRMEKG